MAINKNFVIKNGVEVNTSLIVGDATLNKVGVGTTVPGFTLHVGGSRGGIGATDITITGIATVGTSGSTSAALSVVGVSTFQGDINLLGSAGVSTISFDASLDKLNFADNARATFGTGNDLQIYHEGTYSYISNQSGDLRIDAKDGERGVVVTGGAPDSSVELYYDNTKTFNTTPQGINVVGVTTSLRLNVSGISTLDGGVRVGTAASIYTNGNVAFTGLATANGGVQVGTAASIYTNGNIAAAGIVTANGGLAVGAAITLSVNGNAAFAGIVTVGGDLKVTGDLEIAEDLVLDTNLNILGIASIRNLDGSGAGIGSLSVSGVSTFSGLVNVDAGIAANTAIIEDLTNNRVVIAGSGGELEDSGNLTFDGSTLAVTGDETVSGKITVGSGASIHATTGNAAFAGIATVGDRILVGSGLTLGDGVGNIAAVGVITAGSEIKTFRGGTPVALGAALESAAIRIGTNASPPLRIDYGGNIFAGLSTISANGNAAFAGITTIGGRILVGSGASIHANGNLAVAGVGTINGGLIVGAGATFTGNILPEADGTRDIGASGLEWKDLYIDGTANIDSLAADTAAIGDLTDNRVVIAGSSGELEDDANFTFDGTKLNVGSGVTIQPHGGVSIAGITTIGGSLNVEGNSYFVGMVTFAGGTNGNITLGDNSGDNVVFNADVNSNVIPNTNNTYNLGSSGQQWKDAYVHGVGYIDTVSADNVGIATATIRDSAKLDVDGDARFSGKVAVKDGGNAGAGVTIFDNGNIAASGIVTATTFVGSFSGTVTAATNVTVADESSDTTCFPLFVTAATGDLAPKSGTNLTFNSNTGALTATKVGVNETAPAADLVVKQSGSTFSTQSQTVALFQRSSTTGHGAKIAIVAGNAATSEINLGDTDDEDIGIIQYYHTDNSLRFTANTSEALRITSAGRVNAVGIVSATGGVQVAAAATIFANGNATFSGIGTFGGTSHVRIPVGTTAQRDSNAVNGDIRYNTDLNSYEGYGNGAWGGLGGGTEIDTAVSSTSATNITTFAHASYRSAQLRVQITQGSSYQVGKYLLIHDGTTVTVVEESAIATGDMLGNVSSVINGSNVEVKITMNSASSATVTTIIDKITV